MLPPGPPPEVIGTRDSISVRVLAEGDSEQLFKAISESRKSLAPWLAFAENLLTTDDAAAFIKRVQTNLVENGRFWAGIWRDGQLCGATGLNHLDHNDRQAEFGIWLASTCTGQGIATYAARILIEFLFTSYRLHRISAQCAVENVRSIALMERLGFSREGHLRDAEFHKDNFRDLYIYGLLVTEWPRRQDH